MKKSKEKIITIADLSIWRESVADEGFRIVVTNGCFDLIHVGHTAYLEEARDLGDLLLVGVNSDKSVRELKGDGRPINTELNRALVVASLGCVDIVCIFDSKRATGLLEIARPSVWVKGGDYTTDSLDPTEKAAVTKSGGRIVIIPIRHQISTTQILGRL